MKLLCKVFGHKSETSGFRSHGKEVKCDRCFQMFRFKGSYYGGCQLPPIGSPPSPPPYFNDPTLKTFYERISSCHQLIRKFAIEHERIMMNTPSTAEMNSELPKRVVAALTQFDPGDTKSWQDAGRAVFNLMPSHGGFLMWKRWTDEARPIQSMVRERCWAYWEKLIFEQKASEAEKSAEAPTPSATSSVDLLAAAKAIQEQRAKDYDQPGGERSMGKTVAAWNAITGKSMTESEGWLLMVCLKLVRDRSTATPHRDSLEDNVSYSALHAEARLREGAQPIPLSDFERDLVNQMGSAGEPFASTPYKSTREVLLAEQQVALAVDINNSVVTLRFDNGKTNFILTGSEAVAACKALKAITNPNTVGRVEKANLRDEAYEALKLVMRSHGIGEARTLMGFISPGVTRFKDIPDQRMAALRDLAKHVMSLKPDQTFTKEGL